MIFLMFSLTVLKLIYFLVGKLRTRYYQESREGLYSGPTFLLSYFISSIPVSAITSFLASLILFRYLEEILKNIFRFTEKRYKIVQTKIIITKCTHFRNLYNCTFLSTSLKLGSFIQKLYVDFKNGLNLENPITNESVDPYSPFFWDTLYIGSIMLKILSFF